jgi:beta-glucosidase
MLTNAHRQQARDAARRSILLLKNEKNALPLLDIAGKKIAVIGAYADSKDDMFDFWIAQGSAKDAVTILEGLRGKIGNRATIGYAAGYGLDGKGSEALTSEAVALASGSDVVLVNIGLSGKIAGEDRAIAHPEIPAAQVELLRALRKTGKPIVALVNAGRPLVLTQVQDLADAILYCWILGTETGNAVADVVMGEFNPSAKTVMTFPYAIGQIPVYYNHFNTNRPQPAGGADPSWKTRYLDIPNEPLYPFGYGLSYTSFSYKNLALDKASAGMKDNIQVSVTVTNTGKYEGDEVVQLYIRDVTASIVRPVSELRGFQKINLVPGESKTVRFTLTPSDLSFKDGSGKSILEPGLFKLMVGGNSRDVLSVDLVLK